MNRLPSIVIQKFGGGLLEYPAGIRRAADFITRTMDGGEHPVVVVSAPGRTTDQFIRLAEEISPNPEGRELDMLLSVGERAAMALLAMAINSGGRYQALSFTGSQVGIITDNRHTDAHIIEVKGLRIRESILEGKIPIIAGFQGVSTEREITTLGRGGSDATAVALAIALSAKRCELVKESGAVYSADPVHISDAVVRESVDFATLEAIGSAGARVVQPRAAALARARGMPLTVVSPSGEIGTQITDRILYADAVAAVIVDENLCLIRIDDSINTAEFPSNYRLAVITNRGILTAVKASFGEPGDKALVSVIGWAGELIGNAAASALSALRQAGINSLATVGLRGVLSLLLESELRWRAARVIHDRFKEAGLIGERGSKSNVLK